MMPASENESWGSSSAPFQITRRGEGLLLASFAHVCVAVWNSKPTLALFEGQRAALAATVLRHPGRALFLCIVSSQAEPPDQDVRDASAKMIISHGRQLAGCACVIEGTGFRAAITRTVLTGITLLVRTPSPFGFSDSVPGGCQWLGQHSPRGSLAGLVEEIARARAQ